ncbi:MAG: NAD(P)-dependent oxidoreductase [Candidatus Omnitrophota bacterium]
MYDIVFYEAFHEEQKALKERLPESLNALYFPETIQESLENIPSGRVLCIRTQSIIPKECYGRIEAVLTRSQGYDHLIRMFKMISKPPKLGFLGAYCSRAVAEHAILSMFVLAKKLKRQIKHFATFNRDGLTGIEFFGRKVLVAGVGEIGSQIIDLTKALNMEVRGIDIFPKRGDINYVSLIEGMQWAEIIFCALPLTDETRGYFNYEVLKDVKKGVIFINISRGEISPFEDLVKLLNENILAGVSLDVYQDENVLAEDLRGGGSGRGYAKKVIDFSNRENVLCTPHNAFNTEEAIFQKARITIDSLECFFNTGNFPHPILVQ